jgi:iron complex outermembrane receptor protein
MNVNLNRYLFTLIAFSVFSISAQESSDESANLIEDVIVTSRRREEAAQSVPVAISAFSSSDLLTQNITTTDDLDNIAPNLSFFSRWCSR